MAAPASTSQPPGAESVRVYVLHDSRWELIADLGRSDGSHHTAEAPEQATAQAEGEAEVLLVFCSKGSIIGIAYLLPDAPRQRREEDDEDEDEEEEEDEDGEVDGDGEVGKDDDDVEDEHEPASTRPATEESSSNGSSANKDNKHGNNWGYWEDNTVDKTKFYGLVVEDDDGEEDASTETATDESSSNGSSADKDNKHGAKGMLVMIGSIGKTML